MKIQSYIINSFLKEIELFPELKTIKIGILGRYVARYKITYERQKDMAVCSSCFFMIYQDSFDNRIYEGAFSKRVIMDKGHFLKNMMGYVNAEYKMRKK